MTVALAQIVVNKAKLILGLNINELAKLLELSRYRLDIELQSKTLGFIDNWQHVFYLLTQIENKYGDRLAIRIPYYLHERKTVKQHLLQKSKNRNELFALFDLANELDINVVKIKFEQSSLRLMGIGRIA